jgi:hypothetical protein
MRLLFDKNGNIEKRITALVGKPLELIVKPEYPARKITGYLTLKRANPTAQNQVYQQGFVKTITNILTAALPLPLTIGNTQTSQTNQITETQIDQKLLVQKFDYQEESQGIFKAQITTPIVEGDYEVMTVIEYIDPTRVARETHFTIVVDPEGYVYRQIGNDEARVNEAKVSIYHLNPETDKYDLWPADKFSQVNPIITNKTGKYSFLVPPGTYYLKSEAKGYTNYQSDTFLVREDNTVHMNIEMKRIPWFQRLWNWFKSFVGI